MQAARRTCLLLLALLAWLPGCAGAATVHHELHVSLSPHTGRVTVIDTVSLPEGVAPRFTLHRDLSLRSVSGAEVHRLGETLAAVPLAHYALESSGARPLTFRYDGRIAQTPSESGAEGSRPGTPGLIAAQGVYLDPAAHWYPDFGTPVSFTLYVEGPTGWRAVSQGAAPTRAEPTERAEWAGEAGQQRIGAWHETRPQPGIWLVANAFARYARATPWGEVQAYLREPDAALAERYLAAAAEYLDRYSRLLGAYPYAKFALVENIWESGWGMPSFTLLGPRVIRLPFILHTSYPHEILHNWWGNGVYVDPDQGNWAEGLTTYLADHERAAREGTAPEHRRAALQAYSDHVRAGRDFPLSDFQGREDAVSQAIGYGKGMMLFHMLRLQLGDAAFLDGLRRLYRDHRFAAADFTDVGAAFAGPAGEDLSGFFAQWLTRPGAPRLALEEVRVEPRAGGVHLRGRLSQTQPGPVYRLQVPIAVQLAGEAVARERRIALVDRHAQFDWRLPAAPRRFAVDPRFDLFRQLDAAETPPSLAQAFGAPERLFVLPADAPAATREAYRELAARWARPGDRIVEDAALDALPPNAGVWVLGWENRLRGTVEHALGDNAALSDEGIRLAEARQGREGHVLALAMHPHGQTDRTLVWIGADEPAALPGLARKLPHYGKYSYAVFAGREPDKVLAGQWAVRSPLVRDFGSDSAPLRLAPRPALGAAANGG